MKIIRKWTGRTVAGIGVVVFSCVSLGAADAGPHSIKDLQVPITVIGAVLLVAGPKVWDYLTGNSKDRNKESIDVQLHLSRIDNKLDTMVRQQTEDHDDIRYLRDDIQKLEVKMTTEVGKLHTAFAHGKEN